MMQMMIAHIATPRLLSSADSGGQVLELVVILIITFGSAIAGWVKKQQEGKSQGGKTPTGGQGTSAPPTAPPRAGPPRWPPMGTTTGTTIPQSRPAPTRMPQPSRQAPAGQRPPIASPAPGGAQDPALRRYEAMEAQRRRRIEQMERQVQEQAERARNATAAAEKARREAERIEPAVVAATARMTTEEVVTRIVPDERPPGHQMPDRLRQLLSQPDWRTAILMSEILNPPLSLRDPFAGGSPWA